MKKNVTQNVPKKLSKKWVWIGIILFLLLLVGGFYTWKKSQYLSGVSSASIDKSNSASKYEVAEKSSQDTSQSSIAKSDSLRAAMPTLQHVRKVKNPAPIIDTTMIDSVAAPSQDTTESATIRCHNDTIAPYVYPDPAGGLHHEIVHCKLISNKVCAIEVSIGNNSSYHAYSGEILTIAQTTAVYYRAIDSCGNSMESKKAVYEILPPDTSGSCSKDMALISVGTTRFCIDRFEWPNRKGNLPSAYVSQYAAADSCLLAKKRLCTAEEWTLACSGPYSYTYSYGEKYEPRACVTDDTTSKKSGSRSECRGYFDVYDMSGNLSEWTSSPSIKNKRYFMVMGGYWSSGIESACTSNRYSYFPENRHNPVGFRCCAQAAAHK